MSVEHSRPDSSHRGPQTSLAAGFFQATLFPAVVAAGIAVMMHASDWGIPLPGMQVIVFFAVLALIAGVERVIPVDATWNASRKGDYKTDLASFVVLMAATDPVLKALTPIVLASLMVLLGMPVWLDLFPSDWPFLAQLAVAALIAEFGQYWMHRLAHERSLLWRFHALHHSVERIYWLNGFRVHPLNMVWHYAAGGFVLHLLGAGTDVIVTFFTLSGIVGAFQHANIRLALGPLNYLFSTNELHRWHHSDKPHEGNRNYGGVLIVWDLVFGTYCRLPDARPERLGLSDSPGYPRDSFWRQLVAPFFWSRMMGRVAGRAGATGD